jgi:hypothetical protein
MATSTVPRLAPVTARDGVDTRKQEPTTCLGGGDQEQGGQIAVMSEERRAEQAKFIQTKLKKTKHFEKYGLTLIDDNATIIRSTMGELRNTVLAFFKGGMFKHKRCEHCGTTTARQYERAHDKDMSREAVALAALRRIRPDETKPVKQRDFMMAFVEEHCNVPLWYLCDVCHRKYDK